MKSGRTAIWAVIVLLFGLAPAAFGTESEEVHVYTNEDLERFKLRPVSEVIITEDPANVTTILLVPESMATPHVDTRPVVDSPRDRQREGSTFATIRTPRHSVRRPYRYRSMRVVFN
jgi:hypothetical protein